MRNRLIIKGFNNSEVDNTMAVLEDAGLLKDEVLASSLLRNAIEKRHLGKKGVELFLSQRGIERTLIDKTLSELSDDVEKESAWMLVRKKMRVLQNYPKDRIKRTLWGMLQRRGFSSDTINQVINNIEDFSPR
jgi:regulatory protein